MRRRIYKHKADNRGSTIVLVLVVMALVGMMAAVTLWLVVRNLQMKVTNEQITDNFYSAEGVLDQICSGLEKDESDALSKAYAQIMERYTSYTGTEDEIEEKRSADFKQTYVGCLRTELRGSRDNEYALTQLAKYVSCNTTRSDVFPYAEITSTKSCEMRVYEDSLVLCGVHVEYTDEKGILSIIDTDICLSAPKLEFVSSENLPNLFTYTTIANKGLEVTGSNIVNISSNIYAGNKSLIDSAESSKTSIYVESGSQLTFPDNTYVVAEGEVLADANSVLTTSAGMELWTESIVAKASHITLGGRNYVLDDLELTGRGPEVDFLDGSVYIGYGASGNRADESSAVLINGQDSVLNMTNLSRMILKGYSFIETSAVDNAGLSGNSDVMMGASIGVKGDQIAYLVPAECLGTVIKDGKVTAEDASMYRANPMSYAQYQTIVQSPDKYTLCNLDVKIARTGKSLAEYRVDNSKIQTVFDSRNQMVYFYLNLPANTAKTYFEEYFKSDATLLERYTNFYSNGISTNRTSTIYTAGLMPSYTENGSDVTLSYSKGDLGNAQILSETANLDNIYWALRKKLVTNIARVSDAERVNTIFANLVDEPRLKQMTSLYPGRKIEVGLTSGETAVLLDNENAGALRLSDCTNAALVIATGDVIVDRHFNGTILAKGQISVVSSVNMDRASDTTIKKLLKLTLDDSGSSYYVFEALNDGKLYIANMIDSSVNAGEDDDYGQYVDYRELISYQNWKRM